MIRAMVHFIMKDGKLSLRNPLFLIISVALPLVFVSLYSMVIQVSATNPVVIARESYGIHSDRFLHILRTMGSVDGPYFRIETEDHVQAFKRYELGKAAAVIHIPKDFDRRVDAGEQVEIGLHVVNMNSDGTKNFQLRLEHAIYDYQRTFYPAENITFQEHRAFEQDLSIKRYLGSGLLMFTVIYAAMVITGTLIAREWEDKTVKLLLLSPRGFPPFVAGKWMSALLQTVLITGAVLLVLYIILGYPAERLGLPAIISLLAFYVYGASIGTLLGVTLQKSLLVVPVSAIMSIGHFLLCGYESYIRGFAHSGFLKWAWEFASWLPISGLTDQIRFSMVGIGESWNTAALAWMLLLVAALTAWAILHLKRKLTFAQGQ